MSILFQYSRKQMHGLTVENPVRFHQLIYGRITLRSLLLLFFVTALHAQLPAQTIQTESFRGRDVVAGQIIVRYRDGATPNAANTGPAAESITVRALGLSRAVLLRSGNRNVSDLMQEYSARPDVLYAEPNYIWHKNDVPNDLFFDSQWALRNTGQFIVNRNGTAGADIHAVQAWDIAQGSRSFVIGIVDSGIDFNHPDIAANLWTAPTDFSVFIDGQTITCAAGTHGFNAIARTCDPVDDDPSRHGTHVAGIIGADGDNSLGISGVSRVASMMALKFLGPDGNGNTADAIAAIEFAIQARDVLGVEADIRILNNSWGSPAFSLALLDEINKASSNNMLFVAAAGNDASNSDSIPHFPSGYNAPNIISVAATDNRDELQAESNFGATSVDLGAPGRDVVSARPVMTYVYETGTSMSAAVVSGAAGLVLSGCPGLTAIDLRATLLAGVDVVPALQSKTASGGRLNVYNSLVSCAGAAPPSFTMKSMLPFIVPNSGGSATATISLTPLNGFSSDVSLTASAPAGLNVSLASPVLTPGSSSTILTAIADANLAPGTYVVHVTGTSGNISRTAGLVFIVGSPISPGQNLSGTWSVSSSQPDRFRAGLPPGLANWYQFEVISNSDVDISLFALSFQANVLRLLNSSGVVLATATTSSHNTLEITRTLNSGVYFAVASTGLVSDANYSLALNAPQIFGLNPNEGEQSSSVNIQLTGVQLVPGITVNAGSEIAVSNVLRNDSGSVSATFTVSPNAALGDHAVTVSAGAGNSNTLNFKVVRQRPVITSISPSSGVVGTSVDITILGTGFIDPTVTLNSSAAPATLDNVVVVSTTTITARLTIPINLNPINPPIRVTTLGGFSEKNFQILPQVPGLSFISPSSGSLGSTVDVTLTGDNFFGPLSVSAGNGITVSNVSISLPNRTTATARFTISPTTTLGGRNITVTTPGGTSGTFSFTVVPAPPPSLTSITPPSGPQSTSRTLDVRGTNFTTGLTFNTDAEIVVTSTNIVSFTQATITVQISSTAALGPHSVYLTTPGGTSSPLAFTVLIPPPVLTSISPSSGVQQSSVNTTLTGENFVPGMTIQAGVLSISQISVLNSTSATALVTIPVSTNTGSHNVSVVTPSGTSGSMPFTVLPGIPTLTGITPVYGIRGRDTNVVLSGTNFATGSTTISAIPGVNIVNLSVSGGGASAIFNIDASAPLGPHNITVTTPGGTTGPVTFTIYDPFPDLSIGSNATGSNLFAGLNGTYSVFLNNRGTAAANSVVITDVLPAEFTFVSGGGNGFSCTANGQIVTCTYLNPPFAPQVTFFTVTVAISANAPSSVTHTVSVPLAEDMLPSDNTATATLTIQQVPVPTFAFSPSTLTAGQQANVSLSVPTRLPVDVTGTLTLAFSSSTAIPTDDPAIQFATGGRQVSYVIPANTLQARFGTASIAGPIGFQTGTVAGSFSFSGTAQIGPVAKTFTSTPNSSSLTVAPTPPVIQPARTTSQGGFALLITSSSTSLSITEMVLIFNATAGAQFSCGSAPGCTASGSTLTFDVKSLYDGWFSTGSQFGSLSTLRLPLAIQGNVHGFVFVTLKNALGSSNQMSFSLP